MIQPKIANDRFPLSNTNNAISPEKIGKAMTLKLRLLLYFLILLVMGVNGALYLAWFISPPMPKSP